VCVFIIAYNLDTSKRGGLGTSWVVAPLVFGKSRDRERGSDFSSTSLAEPLNILSSDTVVGQLNGRSIMLIFSLYLTQRLRMRGHMFSSWLCARFKSEEILYFTFNLLRSIFLGRGSSTIPIFDA
jgi:hypothetical protein